MPQKKDSNRIYEMLAKRGLAEPVETDDSPKQEPVTSPSAGSHNDAEALHRFFDDPQPQPQPQQPQQTFHEPPPSPAAPPDAGGFWSAPDTQSDDASMDSLLDVAQIYQKYGIPLNGVDTIYLIEEYISTLPDSLPAEMRRTIVMKIVSASGFNFDHLLNDGIDRVTKLNEYSAAFAARTDALVSEYSAEIESLSRQIDQIKSRINDRKNLHKRQFLSVESEAQRLKEVLDFITK